LEDISRDKIAELVPSQMQAMFAATMIDSGPFRFGRKTLVISMLRERIKW
jgi:hypothetical protein